MCVLLLIIGRIVWVLMWKQNVTFIRKCIFICITAWTFNRTRGRTFYYLLRSVQFVSPIWRFLPFPPWSLQRCCELSVLLFDFQQMHYDLFTITVRQILFVWTTTREMWYVTADKTLLAKWTWFLENLLWGQWLCIVQVLGLWLVETVAFVWLEVRGSLDEIFDKTKVIQTCRVPYPWNLHSI